MAHNPTNWARAGFFAFGAAALVALSGCSGDKSGEVMVYAAQDQVYAEPILREFTQQTGIRVRPVFDSEAVKTVGLANRLLAEKNNPQADVFWGNEELRTRGLEARGVFRETNGVATFGFRSRRIVINTNRQTDYATADGVAYQDLSSVLNPAVDVSLVQFTNSGVDGPVSFPLAMAGALVSNVVVGTDVNLYLTATSTSVDFTFNSRDFTGTNSWPSLTITAVAKPLARIASIERLGTNQVALRFNTVSNWTYAVQGVTGLPAESAGGWSNLFTVPAKPADDQVVYVDTVMNQQRFYRLLLSQ